MATLSKNELLKFPGVFGFYSRILEDLLANKAPRYWKVHSAGGRESGKTYCFTLFVLYCIYYQIAVIIYAFRKQRDAFKKSIWGEFISRLEAAEIKYKARISDYNIRIGKVTILCQGLYNPLGKEIGYGWTRWRV